MGPSLAVLESEKSIDSVNPEDLAIRLMLISQFRRMPKEFLPRLRHLCPQIGCLNACSFCSQNAHPDVYHLDRRGLANLFSALKTVGIEIAKDYVDDKGHKYITQEEVLTSNGVYSPHFTMPKYGLLGYARTNHRPGVVYGYLDNDNGYYPFFDEFLRFAYQDLGVRVRISTVGYSCKNQDLQEMHQRINEDLKDAVAGVRLSFTPYTLGITIRGERIGITSRKQFIADTANFLKTYQPLIERLGCGQRTACVELRFKPLIIRQLPFSEKEISDHRVFRIGNHLLISEQPLIEAIPLSEMSIDHTNRISFSHPPLNFMWISTPLITNDWEKIACNIIDNEFNADQTSLITKKVKLYKSKNINGEYYIIDPHPSGDGYFDRYIYPQTGNGVWAYLLNSERFFLNSLIAYKRKLGLAKNDDFDQATWADVNGVMNDLQDKANNYNLFDPEVSQYIQKNVIPLVEDYVEALKLAGYPASFFFDKNFTIDTGTICNLGRADNEYKELSAQKNMVITAQHERVYGQGGALGKEGFVWKVSVRHPSIPIDVKNNDKDRENLFGLVVEQLDLTGASNLEGEYVFRHFISMPAGIEKIDKKTMQKVYLIPGQCH